ncbi:MAG: hypothetical protein AAFQ12_10340, partial [Pseudomonadota bacterium]
MRSNLHKLVVAFALIVLSACNGSEPAPNDGAEAMAPVVASVETSPAITAPQVEQESDAFKIVMLGDSLTAGFGLPRSEALPAEVERLLKSAGRSIDVINAG